MRTAVSKLELFEPRSLREALRMLRNEAPLLPIAGCTDVYVSLNFGTLQERRFLNLWPLKALRRITLRRLPADLPAGAASAEAGASAKAGDVLSIGALSTYTEIIRSPLVQKRLPILGAASREIGGVQIQNRGTIGGNIANGSPAGDTLPVLAVVEATVVLASLDGERRVPFNAFYTGYRKSVMRPDELVIAIEIPAIEGRQWFRKVGTRQAQAISKVIMAAVRPACPPRSRSGRRRVRRSPDENRDEGGSNPPRIALGSVAPTVVRVPRTEAILGRGGSLEEAQAALAGEIQPIDDIRSTAEYRRRVAANLLARFWKETAPV